MKMCSKCGKKIKEALAKYCGYCKTELHNGYYKCKKCGYEYSGLMDYKWCVMCGTKI